MTTRQPARAEYTQPPSVPPKLWEVLVAYLLTTNVGDNYLTSVDAPDIVKIALGIHAKCLIAAGSLFSLMMHEEYTPHQSTIILTFQDMQGGRVLQ